jgi:hypothetical protein
MYLTEYSGMPFKVSAPQNVRQRPENLLIPSCRYISVSVIVVSSTWTDDTSDPMIGSSAALPFTACRIGLLPIDPV